MKKALNININALSSTDRANVQLAQTIFNDTRLTRTIGYMPGMVFVSVTTDIETPNSTYHARVSVSVNNGITTEEKTITTVEEAVEFALAHGGMIQFHAHDCYKGMLEIEGLSLKGADVDLRGGNIMRSYKPGTCDFTGREFAQGSRIVWYAKTRQVRAL